MTEKELDKLTIEETNAMLKDIDENYKGLKLNIARPKYNSKGELTNEKEVKSSLKLILPFLLVLWTANLSITTNRSIKIMGYTNIYFNTVRRGLKVPKTTISVKEWTKIVDKAVKNRQKAIQIKQVINGNARVLNKRVQNTVLQMYKDGKSYKQTAKELQREFGYNKNKAKQIAITEKNYYKSEAQLQATKDLNIKKVWIHNKAKEPRETHLEADGQIADKNGYFHIGQYKTLAPQHIGVASEDVFCHCTMRVDPIEE